jgi:protein tyrosine phosphatase (PTP) superfamily phosphohydrolase (DUF442 family)
VIYWIPTEQTGRLGVSSRPRGGDWLSDEVASWRSAGVDVVVSLLTAEEQRELDLEAEAVASTNVGLTFFSLPVPDRSVPGSGVEALTQRLRARLVAGESVLIHCRQGIGRSACLAASVLVVLGVHAAEALAGIRQARGQDVPDTSEQRDWILALRPPSRAVPAAGAATPARPSARRRSR